MSNIMDVATIKEVCFPRNSSIVLTCNPNSEDAHIKMCTNISPSLLDLLMATEGMIREK